MDWRAVKCAACDYLVDHLDGQVSTALIENKVVPSIRRGKKAKKNFLPIQGGELVDTSSNIDLLKILTGFSPKKNLKEGILEFVNWYKEYYLNVK